MLRKTVTQSNVVHGGTGNQLASALLQMVVVRKKLKGSVNLKMVRLKKLNSTIKTVTPKSVPVQTRAGKMLESVQSKMISVREKQNRTVHGQMARSQKPTSVLKNVILKNVTVRSRV